MCAKALVDRRALVDRNGPMYLTDPNAGLNILKWFINTEIWMREDFALNHHRVAGNRVTWDEAAAEYARSVTSMANDEWDDICLLYTSGTTGNPKGARFAAKWGRVASRNHFRRLAHPAAQAGALGRHLHEERLPLRAQARINRRRSNAPARPVMHHRWRAHRMRRVRSAEFPRAALSQRAQRTVRMGVRSPLTRRP